MEFTPPPKNDSRLEGSGYLLAINISLPLKVLQQMMFLFPKVGYVTLPPIIMEVKIGSLQ